MSTSKSSPVDMAERAAELLAPLAAAEPDASSRRFQVDRDKIIDRMVEVSLTPAARFSPRARLAGLLALAAGFALVGLAGVRQLTRSSEVASGFPGVTVVALSGQVESPTAEGVVQTSRGARARIETSQGFRLDLAEDSQISVRELASVGMSSTLRLERGRVRCVIPHQPGRTFAVVTADARILDVGTTFSVIVQPTPSGPKTAVDVEEGEVLVEHARERKRLTAGQFWTSPSAPAASTPRTAAPVVEEPAPREPRAAGALRRDASGPKRSAETLSTETQLLREGLASEQRGDLRRAAAFFEQLASQYPGSPLAPDAKAALKRVRARLASAP